MADRYGITQAIAVRRQLDTHRDVASLGKLVAEIAEEPQIITKAFWLDLWNTADRIDLSLAVEAGTSSSAVKSAAISILQYPWLTSTPRDRHQRGYGDTWISISRTATGTPCPLARSQLCPSFITPST